MFKNSNVQGDAGLGKAIAYFTQQGITVAIPLTDSQDYDLIAEIDNKLQKIQVKTGTRVSKNNIPIIYTSVNGGNNGKSLTTKFVSDQSWDYLYCWHIKSNLEYLIPKGNITSQTQLNLGKKYKKFLIE